MSEQTNKYLIVIEKTNTGFSAYSPDVLGCIAASETIESTVENMKLALRVHLKSMREDNEPIPKPRGIESYWEAVRESAGEDYYTYIPIETLLLTISGR